jgi:hypothetical protein
MSLDWCLGIRAACEHWHDAPMLRQTFEALELALDDGNDACIDCSKTVVEVVCRVIVDSFHTPQAPLKPIQETPTLADWMGAAVRALKLGDIRDDRFRKLVSIHHKLADALNDLRNKAGPASHGKDPYLQRLAVHHRRTAVLAADAIVAFLRTAYLDSQLDPASSREPWARFTAENALIDAHVSLVVDDDAAAKGALGFRLPGGDVLSLQVEASRLLYDFDRDAYVEALNAARSAAVEAVAQPEEQEGDA